MISPAPPTVQVAAPANARRASVIWLRLLTSRASKVAAHETTNNVTPSATAAPVAWSAPMVIKSGRAVQ